MAKKVARPARISVKKYDPFRSLGCADCQQGTTSMSYWLAYMPTTFQPKAMTQRRTGHGSVSILNPTHVDGNG